MHVDAMLDALTPQELDEWLAYEEVEPDPPGVTVIVETLKLGFAALCRAWGMKVDVANFDVRKQTQAVQTPPSSRLPSSSRSSTSPAVLSPNQTAAIFRMHMAGRRGR